MKDPLRYFPLILTILIVIFTIMSICLVQVPVTLYTSTNLTYNYTVHGKTTQANAKLVVVGYGVWYTVCLFTVQFIIDCFHEDFNDGDRKAFKERMLGVFVWYGVHFSMIYILCISFPPCSEDMQRFVWFNIQMTCYCFLSMPLISIYFDYMVFYEDTNLDDVIAKT